MTPRQQWRLSLNLIEIAKIWGYTENWPQWGTPSQSISDLPHLIISVQPVVELIGPKHAVDCTCWYSLFQWVAQVFFNLPTTLISIYPLSLLRSKWWANPELIHDLPPGLIVIRLMGKFKKTHNFPTGYIVGKLFKISQKLSICLLGIAPSAPSEIALYPGS